MIQLRMDEIVKDYQSVRLKLTNFARIFFRISQVKNGPLSILLKNIEKTCDSTESGRLANKNNQKQAL